MSEQFPSKNYQDVTEDISKAIMAMGRDMPEVLKGFRQMSEAANKDGALDKKTKELIAMAVAVTARCQGCLGYHAKALVNLDVTDQEFIEMLGVAIYMGGGPSLMTAAEAYMAFQEFKGR